MSHTVVAVLLAWVAGLGVVARAWPRATPLPALAWVAVAGLVGPCVLGFAQLALGLVGLGPIAVPILATMAVVSGIAGLRHRRRFPAAPPVPGQAWLTAVLTLAVVVTGATALRTHLGWDGTVVWLHKARMIAASDGVMPPAALTDRTRIWSAPDYPLHVPLAMAWVLRWQRVDDERALKLLPAAWYAAILCLVAAALVERAGGRWPATRAAAAVLILASAPRLLAGEGSLTSGYADGPAAGLLATLIWASARGRWGRDREWQPLLMLVALCLAWTKQEGATAVLAVALTTMVAQRSVLAGTFAMPALALAIVWQVWTRACGAPATMAYTFAGWPATLSRVPVVVGAYLSEMSAWTTWGALWPALYSLILLRARRIDVHHLVALALTTTFGAVAFLFSAWPDLAAHLEVTVGRQLVQTVPSAVILALGGLYRRPNG